MPKLSSLSSKKHFQELPSLDLAALKKKLEEQYSSLAKGGIAITDGDVLSAALYPQARKAFYLSRNKILVFSFFSLGFR